MNPDEKLGHRISLGFEESEWRLLEAAACICHRAKRIEDLTAAERNRFIRRAVFAVCVQTVKRGNMPLPLAVDLRWETREETDQRLGKPRQKDRFGLVGGQEKITWLHRGGGQV